MESTHTKVGGYDFFTIKAETPTLVGFGDLHVGSATYDEPSAKAVVQRIKDTNALWIGMGDLCEAATKDSIGAGVYEQCMTPEEQRGYVCALLEPIRDSCIGMVGGNHEERIYKRSGVDLMNTICDVIKVPYCRWEVFGMITSANSQAAWTFYAVHSYSGAKTPGLASNAMERDIEKVVDADIFLKGHTHDVVFQPVERMVIDKHNHCVTQRKRYFVVTGSYLNRAGSYVAGMARAGKPNGTVALRLSMDKRNRRVDPEWWI